MSFAVEWALDPECGDEWEYLGTIRITSEAGAITGESVYLDSWLCGLLEAANSDSPDACVDIAEESHPLRVHRRADGSLEIRFGQNHVLAESIASFQEAVRIAAQRFLQLAANAPGENSVVSSIKRALNG